VAEDPAAPLAPVVLGVPLWVPEVGGPINPRNEAHDLVMSVFGGMSKGERNRIKIRVKAAMGAQAKNEGRFLGGARPTGTLSPTPARTPTQPRRRMANGCTGSTSTPRPPRSSGGSSPSSSRGMASTPSPKA
jgi:DNA invertase Pin-like site-specific DNA recombinase